MSGDTQILAPSRGETRNVLIELLRGMISREEAVIWASQWMNEHDDVIGDMVVWNALVYLAAADEKGVGGKYLHHEKSFQRWLYEFDRSLASEGIYVLKYEKIIPPTRAEARQMLVNLLEGKITREEAHDWASPWITFYDGYVEDEVVWEAIGYLLMADAEWIDRNFMFGEIDIQHWLDEIDALVARNEDPNYNYDLPL